MAKYKKQHSSARQKRKVFEMVQPRIGAHQSYVDELARAELRLRLQQALETERDEVVGRDWHDHHQDEGVR